MATIPDPVAQDIAATRVKQLATGAANIIRQSREFLAHLESLGTGTLSASGTDTIEGTRLTVADLLALKALAESVVGLAAANSSGYSKLVTKLAGQR
jgi:hypothetical protein